MGLYLDVPHLKLFQQQQSKPNQSYLLPENVKFQQLIRSSNFVDKVITELCQFLVLSCLPVKGILERNNLHFCFFQEGSHFGHLLLICFPHCFKFLICSEKSRGKCEEHFSQRHKILNTKKKRLSQTAINWTFIKLKDYYKKNNLYTNYSNVLQLVMQSNFWTKKKKKLQITLLCKKKRKKIYYTNTITQK